MHAIVTTVKVENPEASRVDLESARVPLLQRAPGMVHAYWLEPLDGIGMSVIIFESREAADAAFAYPVPPLPGVDVLTKEVREVYAAV
jgi:hypothetical protein